MYSKSAYRDLLKLALDQGYQFIGFSDARPDAGKHIYLRHDVDASLTMALRMAEINNALGIRATFFLLLRSQIYNLLSDPTLETALAIAAAGQNLGFHYALPASLPAEPEAVAALVRADFERVQNLLPMIQPVFSWHNTTPDILDWGSRNVVPGLLNTYSPAFFKDIPYYSDSLARHTPAEFEAILRHGHPTMQLLFHPEIWMGGGANLREISAHVWTAVIRERDYDPDGANPALAALVPNRIPDTILEDLKESIIHHGDDQTGLNPAVTDQLAADLLRQQQALYQRLQADMRATWKRDLPFDELLFDRWERAKELGFGAQSSIYHNSYVYGDVQVGDHTWIGPYTLLDGSGGGIKIGSYCNVSAGVQIYSHHTVRWVLSGGKVPYEKAPVEIGDCTYIGPQTVISKGVRIGDHVVIGAGSLVNSDIPAYTIAFGVPCRPQGRVVVHDDGQVDLIYDSEQPPPT